MNMLMRKHRTAVSLLAIVLAATAAGAAYAQIVNEVTVTGSSPGGTDDVTNTATESVTVQTANPLLSVTKSASDTTDVAAGDTVIYTYTIANTGNQTITNISLADVQEGPGTQPSPVLAVSPLTDNGTLGDSTDGATDNIWDTLAPGDAVVFTASYTVTQSDITTNGVDGDNQLLNTPTATGSSPGNTDNVTDTTDTPFYIDLEDRNPSLIVSKDAGATANVIAGDTITYTYTVTNNGNVPITNVSLSDNVTAGSGVDPTPAYQSLTNTSTQSVYTAGNVIDVLYMGDSATFTGTYVVTQQDVDTLQ